MASLSVIIPTLARAKQVQFLTRCIGSIEAQLARRELQIEVFVGLDPQAVAPDLGELDIPVHFVRGIECSPAAAWNAAAAEATGDYLALLEDDDVWDPNHLDVSLNALEHGAFVSATQLEVDSKGAVVRINDFPTPASWVMPRATWEQVGAFDTSYRLHLDNEWLGRLADNQIQRVHLIESTAPVAIHLARQVRPWLANVIDLGGGRVQFMRHNSPVPLIKRLVHEDSLMHQIASDPAANEVSAYDYGRLVQRYGYIPW